MYDVLIVDDEPLILSGIKFLIDWEANGCRVAGTARNGQQALEAIDRTHPDIVICDINMPVRTGLEVLREAMEDGQPPVFIMLTNYEEFDMARQSLRLKAVDYLLKTQLEAETLEHSLALAKQECVRRGKLERVAIADSYLQANAAQVVAAEMKRILASPGGTIPQSSLDVLRQRGSLGAYLFIQLMMDFSALPALDTFSSGERSRLYAWEREVVEKLAGNVFSGFAAFDPDGWQQSLILFCWDVPGGALETLPLFYAKISSASGNITQTRLSLLATDVLHGEASLGEALGQLRAVRDYYYWSRCDGIYYRDLPAVDWQPLQMETLGNQLVPQLRSRNMAACAELLDKARGRVESLPHRRADALKACAELYSVASMVLAPPQIPEGVGGYFQDSAAMIHNTIQRIATRGQVLDWMGGFKRQIMNRLDQAAGGKSDVLEKIRRYVLENVDKHIKLQDAADYVNISPSYLSALFKKQYSQNFVDFINETKMERACALLCEGKYRIYEISYMLSFENAYYFTKVFKKHTGLTPTEYQHKQKGDAGHVQ